MPIEIEVNLRLPNIGIRTPDEPARFIMNTDARYIKVIAVRSLPKVGETLELSTGTGFAFNALVKRVDWHDGNGHFVVACHYSRMGLEEYEQLRADPDWMRRSLL